MTINGKADRPDLEGQTSRLAAVANWMIAPQSETEQIVCGLVIMLAFWAIAVMWL